MKSKFDKLYKLILEDIIYKSKNEPMRFSSCGATIDADPEDEVEYWRDNCGNKHRYNITFNKWLETHESMNKDNEIDTSKQFTEYFHWREQNLSLGDKGSVLSYKEVKDYETKFVDKKYCLLSMNLNYGGYKSKDQDPLKRVDSYKIQTIKSFDLFDEDRFVRNNEHSERKEGEHVNQCGFRINYKVDDYSVGRVTTYTAPASFDPTYVELKRLITPDEPFWETYGSSRPSPRNLGYVNASCFEEDLAATVEKMAEFAKKKINELRKDWPRNWKLNSALDPDIN